MPLKRPGAATLCPPTKRPALGDENSNNRQQSAPMDEVAIDEACRCSTQPLEPMHVEEAWARTAMASYVAPRVVGDDSVCEWYPDR